MASRLAWLSFSLALHSAASPSRVPAGGKGQGRPTDAARVEVLWARRRSPFLCRSLRVTGVWEGSKTRTENRGTSTEVLNDPQNQKVRVQGLVQFLPLFGPESFRLNLAHTFRSFRTKEHFFLEKNIRLCVEAWSGLALNLKVDIHQTSLSGHISVHPCSAPFQGQLVEVPGPGETQTSLFPTNTRFGRF